MKVQITWEVGDQVEVAGKFGIIAEAAKGGMVKVALVGEGIKDCKVDDLKAYEAPKSRVPQASNRPRLWTKAPVTRVPEDATPEQLDALLKHIVSQVPGMERLRPSWVIGPEGASGISMQGTRSRVLEITESRLVNYSLLARKVADAT